MQKTVKLTTTKIKEVKIMPGLNIAIDLGTSSVTAFVQGKGIIFSESTAICYDAYDNEIICVGNKAGEMFEKAPESLILKRPVVDGIISDFSATTQILGCFIEQLCKKSVFRPKVIISAPSGVTALEKKAIEGMKNTGVIFVLSRLVIAFLPRSKRLLISWLQSPFAVILEPKKIKSVTVSIVSPSICHEVIGPNAMIFVF